MRWGSKGRLRRLGTQEVAEVALQIEEKVIHSFRVVEGPSSIINRWGPACGFSGGSLVAVIIIYGLYGRPDTPYYSGNLQINLVATEIPLYQVS